jgi:lipoate-protein ligase A
MRIILSKNTNPYQNIATEEYLLKNFNEDIFFLYINNQSIIVGKHQNTLSEINYPFISKNNIPVIRRLSGGGTVFHDPGNLNFCFITSGAKNELVNFKKYTTPIISYLKSLGVNAHFGGRNDLLIDGCKISGNACHVFKSRVMHHGTLLFNSQLQSLTDALKNDPLKFKDKAVKSIRSKVTNIQSHLSNAIEVEEFTQELYKYIQDNFISETYELTNEDYQNINQLTKEKYTRWEWNFGYSPKYELKKRIKSTSGKRFEIALYVVKGYIKEAMIRSNSSQKDWTKQLEDTLVDSLHQHEDIVIKTEELFKSANDITQSEFIEALF